MAVRLRQHVGWELFTQEEVLQKFDEVVVDHEVIGLSFRHENKIHWTKYKKKDIPKSIIRQAVRLLQKRNENRE